MKFDDLININPWWKFGKEFWQYDKNLREAKEFIEFQRKKIKPAKGNIYIIRGVRQSGKTTYLKQNILKVLDNNPNTILYVPCDRILSRKELRNIINNFYRINKDANLLYILLDEITYLKDWNLELKTIADSNLIDKTIVFATGSNPVEIKEKAERLPGRRVEGNEYYLKPITFREFILQTIDKITPRVDSKEFAESLRILKNKLKGTSINLEEDHGSMEKEMRDIFPFKEELDYMFDIYLLTGGFPLTINEYLKNRFIEKREDIKNEVYETFVRLFLGDISKIKRSETIAKEIVKGIIDRYGSRYSFSAIAKGLGLPHQTVMEYLEILEDSFLITVFYSSDPSTKKLRFKGDKKIYFSDPFIYHCLSAFLSGYNGFDSSKENLLRNKDSIVEGIIASHLIQTNEIPYQREWKTYLSFVYTSTGKEIDFIHNRKTCIEVKYKEEVDIRDITKIKNIEKYIVLTKNQFELGEITFVPVSVFLSLLERSDMVL